MCQYKILRRAFGAPLNDRGECPACHPERQHAKHASLAKNLGVPRVSPRAVEGEAGVVSEGSGSNVNIRFLASLGMTEGSAPRVTQSGNMQSRNRKLVIQSDDVRGTLRSRRIWE